MFAALPNLLVLVLGLLVLGGLVLVVGVALVLRNDRAVEQRMDSFIGGGQPAEQRSSRSFGDAFSSFREMLNSVSGVLYSEQVFRKLSGANWQLTVAEYLLIRYLGSLFFFVVIGLLTGNLISGLVVAFGFFILPEIMLRRSISQRRTAFQDQLVDVLVLMIGSIRAGHSLVQAIDVVVQDMPPPASEEFYRVKREVELGLPITQALLNFSDRMENEDVDIVVTAININTRVGGNLTVMMNEVVETIRERARLLNEVRSLTSYARYTSYLLTSMPAIAAGILYLLNPEYFDPLVNHPNRLLFVAIPVVLVAIGNFWIQRIANFKP